MLRRAGITEFQRRLLVEIGLFGSGLGLLQKLHCLLAGAEQLKIQLLVVRRGGSLLSRGMCPG